MSNREPVEYVNKTVMSVETGVIYTLFETLTRYEFRVLMTMLEQAKGMTLKDNQAEIAGRSGCSVSTVKRTYSRLKKDGIIKVEGHARVHINPKVVMKLVRNSSDYSMACADYDHIEGSCD